MIEQTGCSNGACHCLKQETVWLLSFISVIKSGSSPKPLAVLGAGWMEKFSKCGRGNKKEGGTLKNTGFYRQETGKPCAHCRNLKQGKSAWYGSTTVPEVFCACRIDQFALHFAVDISEQHKVAVSSLKLFK